MPKYEDNVYHNVVMSGSGLNVLMAYPQTALLRLKQQYLHLVLEYSYEIITMRHLTSSSEYFLLMYLIMHFKTLCHGHVLDYCIRKTTG